MADNRSRAEKLRALANDPNATEHERAAARSRLDALGVKARMSEAPPPPRPAPTRSRGAVWTCIGCGLLVDINEWHECQGGGVRAHRREASSGSASASFSWAWEATPLQGTMTGELPGWVCPRCWYAVPGRAAAHTCTPRRDRNPDVRVEAVLHVSDPDLGRQLRGRGYQVVIDGA